MFSSHLENVNSEIIVLQNYFSELSEYHEDDINLYLEPIFDSILISFNKSVLSGEYVYFSEIENDLKELLRTINIFLLDIHPDIHIQNEVVKSANLLKSVIHLFNEFIISVKVKHYDRLYQSYAYINKSLENDSKIINRNFDDKVNFFNDNLYLALFDHFQSDDIKRFNELLNLLENIREFSISVPSFNIVKLSLEKINFLIYKLRIRIKLQTRNLGDISSIYFDSYYLNGDLKSLINYNSQINKINYWKEYIENHYQFNSDWFNQINLCYRNQYNIQLFDSQKFHLFTKYYKDISNDYHNLSKLVVEFDNHIYLNIEYNNSVKLINKNYLVNNSYSLFISDKENSIEDIHKEYLKCKRDTENISNNFFLEYKFLKGFLDRVNITLSIEEFVKQDKFILSELFNVIDKYTNNKDWSIVNQKYIFVSPYEECLIDVNESIYGLDKLFIASSFILPIDKKEIAINYDKITLEAKSLKTQLDLYNKISNPINDIKSISDKIKNDEKKSIEIISIFTAIITFVLSSIPAIKFIDTFYQATLFVIATGCSLALFVVLILLSQKGFKKSNENFVYISSIIFVLIIVVYTFIQYESTSKVERNKNIELIKENDKYIHYLKEFKDSVELNNSLKLNYELKDSLKPSP